MEHNYDEIIRLANVWRLMQRRAGPGATHPRYAGRGISVCAEWSDRDTFIHWALTHGYKVGLELDRRDNDGNYEPDNCWFRTRKQNMRNTSRARFVTAFGETRNIQDWVDDARCTVTVAGLRARIDRFGWSSEKAITTPERPTRADKGKGRKWFEAFGEVKTAVEWSQDPRCVVKLGTLRARLKGLDWSTEAAITEYRGTRKNKVTHEAFGDSKTLAAWARDPRCVVAYDMLQRRVSKLRWNVEVAVKTPAMMQYANGEKVSHVQSLCRGYR